MSASPPWAEPPPGRRLWCGGSLRAFLTCRTWEPVRKANSGSTGSGIGSWALEPARLLLLGARVDAAASSLPWLLGRAAVALPVMDSGALVDRNASTGNPRGAQEQASQRPQVFRASPHTPSNPSQSHKGIWVDAEV